MPSSKIIYSICLISIYPFNALAAPTDNIEKIVVTASGYEQNLSQAPASITVIDRSQIENSAYRDITDALKSIPGVSITGGGSRRDISMRGMPAQYTALLVDGKKQSGRESQPNGSGGFEQDWLPPLEAIDRIEVVRGPMSTLYGSDAIGGVINIITRKNYAQWSTNIRAEAMLQENSESGNEYQGQVYIAGPLIKDLLSANITALYQEREEDNIERAYPGKELTSYRGTLHLTPSQSDTLSLAFSKHNQTRTSTSGMTLPERNNSSETNNNRHSVSLTHSGNYDWGTANSYIQNETVENIGRDITVDNLALNTQWSLAVSEHLLTLGANFDQETLNDTSTNLAAVTEIDNRQWAIFAEDDWAITDNFTLTLGLRLDDNQQFNSHISPRIYGVWNASPSWTIKTGVSTGYRAPDLREMHPEWIQESRGGNIYGNPDLSPETSISKEIAIYYLANKDIQASVTFFHNDFEDKINLVSCPITRCNEETAQYNINIDKAQTYGAELSTQFSVSKTISLSTSYSYTHSEQQSGDDIGLPLTQTPEHLFAANLDWQISNSLKTWLGGNYRSKESEPTTVGSRSGQAPSVTFVDLGSAWEITDDIKVMFGIYNLFDKITTYDDYGYVEDGRRYWLAIDTQF